MDFAVPESDRWTGLVPCKPLEAAAIRIIPVWIAEARRFRPHRPVVGVCGNVGRSQLPIKKLRDRQPADRLPYCLQATLRFGADLTVALVLAHGREHDAPCVLRNPIVKRAQFLFCHVKAKRVQAVHQGLVGGCMLFIADAKNVLEHHELDRVALLELLDDFKIELRQLVPQVVRLGSRVGPGEALARWSTDHPDPALCWDLLRD